MDAETLLRRWAAAKLDRPVEDIEEVIFEHEEGYTNDSGTSWPEQYVVSARLVGLRGRGSIVFVANVYDGWDSLPEFLAEVLTHA